MNDVEKCFFVGEDHIRALIINHMGYDMTPIMAARMSYGAEVTEDLQSRQRDFLNSLLKRKHMTPFEHCVVTFKLEAPIFVFRQLFRYRTASISEKSLRYSEADPMFYISNEILISENAAFACFKNSCITAIKTYHELLKDHHVLKQEARQVLPVTLFSFAVFTINLRNLFHIFDERLTDHAQKETRLLVSHMKKETQQYFPEIIDAYDKVKEEENK